MLVNESLYKEYLHCSAHQAVTRAPQSSLRCTEQLELIIIFIIIVEVSLFIIRNEAKKKKTGIQQIHLDINIFE